MTDLGTPTIMILIGAGLTALGSFLPWLTATAPFVGTISTSGLDQGGDGVITLVLGIVLALTGFALLQRREPTRRLAWLTVAAGLGAAGVAAIDLLNVQVRAAMLKTDLELSQNMFADSVTISAGMGLYAIMLGGFLALAAGAMVLKRTSAVAG